jgi:hypothetical protein
LIWISPASWSWANYQPRVSAYNPCSLIDGEWVL